MKDVWKCITTVSGDQYVITDSTTQKPQSSAALSVSRTFHIVLALCTCVTIEASVLHLINYHLIQNCQMLSSSSIRVIQSTCRHWPTDGRWFTVQILRGRGERAKN